jgi:transposase
VSFVRKIKRKGRVYLAEVENQRDGVRVRQKVIRYLGRDPSPSENAFPKNISELQFDSCKVYGSVFTLDFIAKKLGLYELLGEHAHPILVLTFFHCHDYQSISKTEQWFQETDLQKVFGSSEITEKRLRDAVFALGKMDKKKIQKSIFENILGYCGVRPEGVLFDVTNTYFTGSRSSIAKPGMDKQGVRGRPLVQIGLAVTKEEGFPIFHQVHPGNVHDNKIFNEAISYLKLHNVHRGLIVFDRGITSKTTVAQLASKGWKTIGGMPLHRGIKDIISKMDLRKLQDYSNRVEQGSTDFYVFTVGYQFGTTLGRLAIVLNGRKGQAQTEERRRLLSQAQGELLEGKEVIESLKKFFNKKNRINTHALRRQEKYDGLSFIFTNAKLSRAEIIRIYFGRDVIEKSFQCLKGPLGLRPIRSWLQHSVESHIFICYLSYALLTTFSYLLRKNEAKLTKNGLPPLSIEDALHQLTKVYRIYFHRGSSSGTENPQLYKLVTLTRHQEAIMRAISPKLIL